MKAKAFDQNLMRVKRTLLMILTCRGLDALGASSGAQVKTQKNNICIPMSKLTLEISSDLAEALRLPADERLARLQQELAIRLYQKGLLSFGKARGLAALSKWEFHELLSQEGIDRSYDEEELENDLATLEVLG